MRLDTCTCQSHRRRTGSFGSIRTTPIWLAFAPPLWLLVGTAHATELMPMTPKVAAATDNAKHRFLFIDLLVCLSLKRAALAQTFVREAASTLIVISSIPQEYLGKTTLDIRVGVAASRTRELGLYPALTALSCSRRLRPTGIFGRPTEADPGADCSLVHPVPGHSGRDQHLPYREGVRRKPGVLVDRPVVGDAGDLVSGAQSNRRDAFSGFRCRASWPRSARRRR